MSGKKNLQNQYAVTANEFIKVQYQTTTIRYLCSRSEQKIKKTKLKNTRVEINFAVKRAIVEFERKEGGDETRACFLEYTAFEFD